MTEFGLFAPTPVFGVLVVFGIARAFLGPAMQSLAPNLVPEKDLSNAIAWNSTAQQTATITGPVTGGLLYGLGVTVPFFALVLAGYLASWRHVLPESAIPGLNAFVLYFALPCMLFRFGLNTPIGEALNRWQG